MKMPRASEDDVLRQFVGKLDPTRLLAKVQRPDGGRELKFDDAIAREFWRVQLREFFEEKFAGLSLRKNVSMYKLLEMALLLERDPHVGIDEIFGERSLLSS